MKCRVTIPSQCSFASLRQRSETTKEKLQPRGISISRFITFRCPKITKRKSYGFTNPKKKRKRKNIPWLHAILLPTLQNGFAFPIFFNLLLLCRPIFSWTNYGNDAFNCQWILHAVNRQRITLPKLVLDRIPLPFSTGSITITVTRH